MKKDSFVSDLLLLPFSPDEAFKRLIAPKNWVKVKWVIAVSALLGLPLQIISSKSLDLGRLYSVIPLLLAGSFAVGYITMYLSVHLSGNVISSLLGSKGKSRSNIMVMAFSSVISILYSPAGVLLSTISGSLSNIFALLAALYVWYVQIIGIKLVNGVNGWKAFMSTLVPGIIIGIIVGAIIFLFKSLSGIQ